MSTQAKPEYVEEALTEETISGYLAAHPDFFERNPKLLGRLRIPHETGGTVSLVERQLRELIHVARANDALAAKIHKLSIHLLAADSLDTTVTAVEEAMRSGFGADHSVLVLFGNPDSFEDVDAGRFFRAIERDHESLRPFATFLKGSGPRCGQVRDSQRKFLFRGEAEDIGSIALVPLGSKAAIGFLAIGSVDANRFHPGMSIDFLARVGDLISGALKRY